MQEKFETILHEMPLFAVLRGIRPEDALDVAITLFDSGLRILEVTLNSPEPFRSIEIIANKLAGNALIGAGTVTTPDEVAEVKAAGGELIISPNTDLQVIEETKRQGLFSLPGCFTPSEAFAALKAGADGLKMFPAENLQPKSIKAMRAVLPKETNIFVVGGVNTGNMADFVNAGADGFGAGSSLYKPGKSLAAIARDGAAISQNLREALKR